MWFKNIHIYAFQEPMDYKPADLAEELASCEFVSGSNITPISIGWTPPMNKEEAPLVHAANGFMLLSLKMEEKIIPTYVVKEMLNEKISEIEENEARKVYRKEKETLKDELYYTLLPRAFSKVTRIYGYIDPIDNLLVINAGNPKQADTFIDLLRKSLGGLKVSLPEVKRPASVMTLWLKTGKHEPALSVEDACVLQNTDDKGSYIRLQRQDIESEQVQSFLDKGCEVSQMKLTWADQVTFILKDDFTIRSLQFLDIVQEQANDVLTETDEQRFDSDFVVMTSTLRQFLKDVFAIFAEKSDKKSTHQKAATTKEPVAA